MPGNHAKIPPKKIFLQGKNMLQKQVSITECSVREKFFLLLKTSFHHKNNFVRVSLKQTYFCHRQKSSFQRKKIWSQKICLQGTKVFVKEISFHCRSNLLYQDIVFSSPKGKCVFKKLSHFLDIIVFLSFCCDFIQ